ncbi:MAG: GAF domain-containing protein [Chloroflexota bacterium]|nr:GAF domain-containing protein [Chloroflexota bacterium]
MRSTFDRLFIHPRYSTQAELAQMRLIVGTTLVLVLLQTIFIAVVPDVRPSFARAFAGDTFDIFILILVYGCTALALVAARSGWTTVAGLGMLGIWLGGAVFLSIQQAFLGRTALLSPLVLVILGFIALGERGVVLTAVIGFIAFLLGVARRDMVTFINAPDTVEIFNLALVLLGITIVLILYRRIARTAQRESRAEADDARLRLATITTDIAQRIASRKALDEVLTATVEEIRGGYAEVYHAQIFLIDEFGAMARLVASTGEVGALLLSRGHALEVGSQSVIGRVTRSGTIVVARAGSTDTVHKRNELLPETLVEAAFPLILDNRVIGALDLQSRDITAFADQDLPIFQSLADNTAVAIENARLYEQTQSRLRENQRLLDQMRGAMREIERLNRELTGRSWADYLENYDSSPSIEFDFETDMLTRGSGWTATLRQAIVSDRSIQDQRADMSVIAIPIRVRGQVIGAMEFELDESAPLVESIDLAQTVGERFGLALENTRLYEATQRVAQREQRVNAIAAQYQNVTTVDELLRITVSELGDLLGADRASIRLGSAGIGSLGAAPPLIARNSGANGAGHASESEAR